MGTFVTEPSSPSVVVTGLDRTGMDIVGQFLLKSIVFVLVIPNGSNQKLYPCNARSKCASPLTPRVEILTRTWDVSTLKRVFFQGLCRAASEEKNQAKSSSFHCFPPPPSSLYQI